MKSNVLLVALSAAVLASCAQQTARRTTPFSSLTADQLRHGDPDTYHVDSDNVLGGTGNPGTVHPEEGTYIIAAGDYPATSPVKYKVKLDDLIAINGWTLVNGQVPEFNNLAPGTTIRIPPSWTEPAPLPTPPATPAPRRRQRRPRRSPEASRRAHLASTQSLRATTRPRWPRTSTPRSMRSTRRTSVPRVTASFHPGVKIKTPPKANC